MPLPPRHILSKSTFLYGCQCPKKLWLYKNRRDLLPELTASRQMVFEKGTDVGLLARQLFPGGKDASPPDPFHYPESIAQTQQWVGEGEPVIYEAAFQFDNVMAALDILENRRGRYYAYEVKSSSEIKDYQLLDAALQYYVMTNAGLPLQDIFIVYLNKEYVRKGELELEKLFIKKSVKKEVLELLTGIPAQIEALKQALRSNNEPVIDIGPHCSAPFPCDFMGYCWSHIPETSVFDLARMRTEQKFQLYYEGIVELHQLHDGVKLTAAQRLQVRAHLEGYTHIERDKIRQWLKQLKYPLCFIDFETFMPGVPLYENTRPYQHIPFQFSAHKMEKPGAEARHYEYLGEPETDPRPEFLRQLVKVTKVRGSILVYSAFEASRLKELKTAFPEYAPAIDDILNRIVDLMEPFQKKWYYLPSMNGSYSIKDVLPALVPEMNYEGLSIGDGGTAMAAFEGMLKIDDKKEREKIRKALLEYCGLDTEAMLRVWEKLAQLK